jgi:hypothetical protein
MIVTPAPVVGWLFTPDEQRMQPPTSSVVVGLLVDMPTMPEADINIGSTGAFKVQNETLPSELACTELIQVPFDKKLMPEYVPTAELEVSMAIMQLLFAPELFVLKRATPIPEI